MTTAELEPLSLAVPLHEDPPGVIRVGNSRVLLELVIGAFQRGETPESIVQSYDTLSLQVVYAVIGYYLAKPNVIDDYMRQSELRAEKTRSKIEAGQPSRTELRDRLISRARTKGLLRVDAGN